MRNYVFPLRRYLDEIFGGDMSIASDLIRGNTDTIILSNLANGDNYGYQINKSVSTITCGEYEFKEATLYSAFKRLEESGCIESYWGEESKTARRRYYKITELGKRVLETLRTEWINSRDMIDKLVCNGE